MDHPSRRLRSWKEAGTWARIFSMARFNEAAAVWAAEGAGVEHHPHHGNLGASMRPRLFGPRKLPALRQRHATSWSCFNEAAAVWAAEGLQRVFPRHVHRFHASMRPRLFGPRKPDAAFSELSCTPGFNEAAAVWAAEA